VQSLGVVDGGSIEVEDHDARDERPSERTHPTPSVLTRFNGITGDLTQA
jgi:hypothetical protein